MKSNIDALFSNDGGMGFVINWQDPEKGFGQIMLRQDSNGKFLSIDSEHTGRDFVKRVFCSLVDQATIDGE
jgi:hypothetical protein